MSSELWRRIAFTLGALFVFRIGTYIPLPGIDIEVWSQIFRMRGGGILGVFNTLSGGGVSRLAIFALGIAPYVSAAIILQLVSFFAPRLRLLRSSGEPGRGAIDRYTFALTILLTAFQSYGIAIALESIRDLIAEPGLMFRVTVVLTLTGGTFFLVWLADQITWRGIGNGIALILCAAIVAEIPSAIFDTFELNRQGLLSGDAMAGLAILSVALVGFAVFVEKARRNEPISFEAGRSADLSFKLNGAGIIPSYLASWLLAAPVALLAYLGPSDPATRASVSYLFDQGQPLFLIGYALAIFLCVYLYTAFVIDPAQAAENLKRYGGRIAQIEPGEATAEHIDRILTRVTLVGAVYFVGICLVPELLLYRAGLPFYLGGTSLLILVCTVLDVEKQARAFALIK